MQVDRLMIECGGDSPAAVFSLHCIIVIDFLQLWASRLILAFRPQQRNLHTALFFLSNLMNGYAGGHLRELTQYLLDFNQQGLISEAAGHFSTGL